MKASQHIACLIALVVLSSCSPENYPVESEMIHSQGLTHELARLQETPHPEDSIENFPIKIVTGSEVIELEDPQYLETYIIGQGCGEKKEERVVYYEEIEEFYFLIPSNYSFGNGLVKFLETWFWMEPVEDMQDSN